MNKATLQTKIAELVNDKKIDGISDIRDESDKSGMRVVIEGVERLEQCHTLLNLGCRLGQGFLFSKPIQAEQLDQLLKAA